MSVLALPTAEVFEPLLAPARYKGAWGGRGSGKSHFFAELLIDDALSEPGQSGGAGLLSVCIRQVQKSLKQSSKRLIEAKLKDMRLGERQGFKVFKEQISTPGDGVITFQGMQDHTAESIKSLEGFKRAWWEEAQAGTKYSLSLLRPTIRAPGSQLWFSWNARRKSDPVDVMLRGSQIPTGAVVVRANWQDNPWFTPELEQERLDCLRMEPDQYGHIWDGDYVTAMSGAYYARAMALAKQEGRIGRVAADPLMTLRAYWDIGGTGAKADACAIWIVQFIGREVRVLRYYEAVGQPLATHVDWLRRNGFSSAMCVLPHDGAAHDKVFSVSYESELRKAGFEVKVIPNMGAGAAMTRIESARRLFPSIWFNSAPVRDLREGPEGLEEDATEAGRDALGWYHEKRDESRNIGFGPNHDWASHGADSFGMMAVDYLSTDRGEPDTSGLDNYTTDY
ncbi:phage terminase large subunit [Xanthomonas sp. NCPPB 3005]|uniref:phage terminase large subunit n=1 Tax=Xanthomonas sp. NCPPB 3005 TaxID=3240913 RepID=UPI00351230B9